MVSGNYIGTDVSGAADLGNTVFGVFIGHSAQSNTVGGTTAGERNIISGNGNAGVRIETSATNNVVSGNYVGTDVTGTSALGNAGGGFIIGDDVQFLTIGGTTAGERNIISGNAGGGVNFFGARTKNNTVSGNYIGTDVTGTAALENSGWGIRIADGAQSNTIGGTTAGERNIISGNDRAGVLIVGTGTDNNVVSGNYIGTDVDGTGDLGNSQWGVLIAEGAKSNTIGGTTAGERNIISGNFGDGVLIGEAGTDNNVVSGNYIGTDVTGTADLGNQDTGVGIVKSAKSNTIGGTAAGERNIISGNGRLGVGIEGAGTNNNVVSGNYIGTDVNGTTDLGNFLFGIIISDGAQSNTIGGTTAGERNIISGNGLAGVSIADPGSVNNVVKGNFIGTDVSGTEPLGNTLDGVFIVDGARSNIIGGESEGEGNVISGNEGSGVFIANTGTTGNVVQGNFIGTDVTGTVSLGNRDSGVNIAVGAQFNTVGGTTEGARNIISGNQRSGVVIIRPDTDQNVVIGNYIGPDVTGMAAIGNGDWGVVIRDEASLNRVGSDGDGVTDAAEGNVISGNASDGVRVESGTGNVIRSNSIFSNGGLGIDLGEDGVTPNDLGDRDTGPNNLQNFPVISFSTQGPTRIVGTLNSLPNEEFAVDFYVNRRVDRSRFGEGERYLGSAIVISDSLGDATYDVTFAEETRLGEFITATATDSMGSTSEFSEVVLLSDGGPTASAETFVVTNTRDSGARSLRESIVSANMNPGFDTIVFDIPGQGPHTIQPISGLPEITDAVFIDGFTQSGASPNTNLPGLGSNAVLKIELDGSNAGGTDGLAIIGANCIVKGLVINRFRGSGILIDGTGASGNVVEGNFIGTDSDGTLDLGNFSGVVIEDAPNNTVGGSLAGEGNLISGNNTGGIFVSCAGASGNVVQGNLIGTDVTGRADMGNGGSGVIIQDAPNNTIGGSQQGEGNIISGNGGDGIAVGGAGASGNAVQGNYIGTDATGSNDLGNVRRGVLIIDAPDNTIGGSQAGKGNIISGNDWDSIFISRASGNVVQGNYIGTDVTGSADLGNGSAGVSIDDAPENTVGGAQAGEGNVISGNHVGIFIGSVGASGNVVLGNYIGTDATGSADLGNANIGVRIRNAPNNTVGGAQPGERNVISGNDEDGIFIGLAGASGNVVQGNFIGTDATGSADLGNGDNGVQIADAPDNAIGGLQAGEGNVISGNGWGIFIVGAEAKGNVVQGNLIGTDATGSADLGNGVDGVLISDAPDNTIGGAQAGEGNVIAFNDFSGVAVGSSPEDTSVSNSIRGNEIYSNGALGIDIGDDGVSANDDLDADAGPNNFQNFPVITSALATESSTRIVGSLGSLPNEEYTLDFYASSEADVSNHGEGERYLGSAIVMSDGFGEASFDVTFAEKTRSGEFITATATDSTGSTSEFSEVIILSEGGPSFSEGEPPAPSPFESAVELSEGWWFSDWLGSFNTNFLPWIFHAEHSWMYLFEESTSDDIFLYDLSLEGWIFTNSAIYPGMYSFGRNGWIFYFVATSGPRQFVDLESGEFFSLE